MTRDIGRQIGFNRAIKQLWMIDDAVRTNFGNFDQLGLVLYVARVMEH